MWTFHYEEHIPVRASLSVTGPPLHSPPPPAARLRQVRLLPRRLQGQPRVPAAVPVVALLPAGVLREHEPHRAASVPLPRVGGVPLLPQGRQGSHALLLHGIRDSVLQVRRENGEGHVHAFP